MNSDIYPEDIYVARRSSGALRGLVAAIVVLTGLWMAFTATALLTIVTPAVLPGASLSIPGVTTALERLPGGLAVSPPGPEHPFNEPISILVMGVDKRPDDSNPSVRTDSIALLRLDPVTHRVTVLSFPRDLWVAINAEGGAYWERINASYREGATTGGSVQAGARQLMRDLEANFGATADHYIWLDMAGARELIDARGGVDVTIPESLSVPEWRYTEDDVTNPQIVSFPAGEHHLSGYEAVAFSRYRGDSDLYRAQRQQLILRSMLSDPFSLKLLLNPFGAWQATRSAMHSDLSVPRLATFAFLASRSSDDIEVYSLGEDVNGSPTVLPMVTAEGAQVLDWNADNVAYWVEQARATR